MLHIRFPVVRGEAVTQQRQQQQQQSQPALRSRLPVLLLLLPIPVGVHPRSYCRLWIPPVIIHPAGRSLTARLADIRRQCVSAVHEPHRIPTEAVVGPLVPQLYPGHSEVPFRSRVVKNEPKIPYYGLGTNRRSKGQRRRRLCRKTSRTSSMSVLNVL